jgi:hypothetical protein
MKEINQENLDTAIALGDAVCKELGICCEKRGQVIFQVYKKLEELKPKKDTNATQQSDEAQAEKGPSLSESGS